MGFRTRATAILLTLAATQAAADSRTIRFDLEFAGGSAGVVELEVVRDGDRYAATALGRPADWLDSLYSARLSATGEGAAEPAPRPDRFETDLRFGDDAQQVEGVWNAAGAPTEVLATPAFRPKPWQIDPADQAGTADPLSVAVRLLAGREPSALCGEAADIFDGRRRSRVSLGEPEPFKGGWRCLGDWRRVAGYAPESLEAPPTEIRAYFVPFADGRAHLSKLEVITRWGTGSARRAN